MTLVWAWMVMALAGAAIVSIVPSAPRTPGPIRGSRGPAAGG